MNSAKTKVIDYYKDLPSWAKGVVIVAGVGLFAYAGIKLAKVIFPSDAKKKQKESVDKVKKDIAALAKQGIKPTYNESQYIQWADSLAAQFEGCDFGQPLFPAGMNAWLPVGFTGWSASGAKLANIALKIKNDMDFAKLVSAYGVRTHDQCGYLTGNFTGSLPSAVSDELSQSEINTINKYLKAQKITYQF